MANSAEQKRRWRMVLGGDGKGLNCKLSAEDQAMDKGLQVLYGKDFQGSSSDNGSRRGGMEKSSPALVQALGDIRGYFPDSVIEIIQKDVVKRVGIAGLLDHPDLMETITADVHLVAQIISLKRAISGKTRASAEVIVRKVVKELESKLRNPMQTAVKGSLNRSIRNLHPKHNEINWQRTILANLKHYQPDYKTVIPEKRIGYGRKRSQLRDIILCVDQSGSMASSVVYAGVYGAVLASIKAVRTHMVLFSTDVVDVTADISDPVDILFSTQIGGGTDINRAVGYCQGLVESPTQSIMVLITDLYEGGNQDQLLQRANQLVQSGVNLVVLLALDDSGKPSYDANLAEELAEIGVPSFACTPEKFPDLMAAAINREEIGLWANKNDLMVI